MNRASTSSWGLLGPTKHWAKAWKLGVDKVQRDVGDSACGPAHTEQGPFAEGRMEGDELSLGSWLPLNNTTGKQLKHGAVSSSKKEDDRIPILNPWVSFHEHSQSFTTRVPNHGVSLSPESLLSIWGLNCCLRKICYDGG